MADKAGIHPEKDDLTAYGLGKLPPAAAAKIETHLDECPSCCDTMSELQDDTFLALVKKSPPAISDETDADGTSPEEASHSVFQPTVLESDDGNTAFTLTGEDVELPRELREHNRYRILEHIGRGGMGDVYKAEHMVMNRPVALKVIKPELVQNKSAIKRFHREVQAAARLHHGNIVTAHDAERAGNSHFLVMEFVDGVNLDEVLKERGPLPVEEACDVIRQTAVGLEHAHSLGMVHRDIKPHNLMLTEAGDVKILDFGLASFASQAATEEGEFAGNSEETQAPTAEVLHQLTQMGTMMGTPDYIAPEQAKDARKADIRADIYSLGCTFYTLLAGKPPFKGDSVVEKLTAHAQNDPEPLSKFREDVPAEVETILRKMMAKDPAERYQTPAEVAEAVAGASSPSKNKLPSRKRNPRQRRLILIAVVGVIAALIAVAVYYIQTDYGVVRVEVADESLKVELGGQTITATDGEKHFKIRPGAQKLFVKLGDVEFYTDDFELRRGEDLRFKIELQPGEIVVMKEGQRFGARPTSNNARGEDGEAPVMMAFKENQKWYLDGRPTTKEDVSKLLREIFKEHPNREVVIETPQQFGISFVKQMHQIVRISGGKRIRWPDWSHPHQREEEWNTLAGRWQAVSAERDGIPDKSEQVKDIKVLVKDEKITFLHQGKTDLGIIDIQPTTPLKEIDLHAPAVDGQSTQHRRGIYELTPNRSFTGVEYWRICLGAPGQPRPKVFSTNPGTGGGSHLLVLSRVEAGDFLKTGDPVFDGVLKDALAIYTFEEDTFYREQGRVRVRDVSGHGQDASIEDDRNAFAAEGRVGGGLACNRSIAGFAPKGLPGSGIKAGDQNMYEMPMPKLRLPEAFLVGREEYTVTVWVRDAAKGTMPSGKSLRVFFQEGFPKGNNAIHPLAFSFVEQQIQAMCLGELIDPSYKNAQALPPEVVLPKDEWFFLALTLVKQDETSTLRITVNDKTIEQPFAAIPQKPEGGFGLIGGIDGMIDELAFFKRALSEEEIQRLRQHGLNNNPLISGKKPTAPLPPLDEDQVTLVREFQGHTNIVKSVDFSPDGNLIASASGFPRGDNSVRIWNRETGKEIYRLDDHFIPVVFVTFSPDGKRLLSGDIHGRMILGNLGGTIPGRRQKVADWTNDKIMVDEAVFTPDGKRIVYLKVNPHAAAATIKKASESALDKQEQGSLKGLKQQALLQIKRTIEIVDATNGKSVMSIPLKEGEAAMSGLAVTPDGTHVAVPMYDGTVRLISLGTDEEIQRYEPPENETPQKFAFAAAVSPDGNKLAAGYGGHKVRIWDLKTGKVLTDLRTANQSTNRLKFFSDNRRLAVSGPVVEAETDASAACIVDTETREILATTPAILGDGLAFALATDEKYILTAGGAYWDAASLKWQGTNDYDLHLWRLPGSVSN